MPNILIADDHEVVRRGLRQILSDEVEGTTVSEAMDAKSTLAQITQGTFDLILLDLNMPAMDGLELLTEIKRLKPNLPVIVLTVASETIYAVKAMQYGASGFINKRDAADELVAAVKHALAGETHFSANTLKQAANIFRGGPAVQPHDKLSRQEFAVFQRIAIGKAIKEIAFEMQLSEKTVATYLERVREKTGLKTHVEIARYALQNKLVE
jgi:DNA-binding NarL/FixJ family response regulator